MLLEAGVYDRTGRFVSGLSPAHFAVKEDGVAQTIDLVSHERVPATFALLIDSSQSMSRRFDFVREAAGRLTAFLRPNDSVVVAPFAKRLQALTGPTGDRRTIVEAIQHIEPSGGTAILDSLIELSERLPRAEDRRSVILISDGYDEHSHASFEQALAAVKGAGITIYVVGIGGVAGISLKGERELKRLANETGGRVFFPPRAEELASVYDQLAADAQNRYLVTYTPTNTARDGGWRAVDLSTPSAQYLVRTRDGYRAPKPPPIRPTLEFTVTDLTGQYVEISADDLVVSEDGVDQKVDTFHEAATPVSIVLATRFERQHAKDGRRPRWPRRGRSSMRSVRKTSCRCSSSRTACSWPTTSARTARRASTPSTDTGRSAAPRSTTPWEARSTTLKPVEGRRAVVVMTDGRDENNAGTAPGSTHTLPDVLKLAREVEATVLPIGLGTNLDRAGARTSRGHFRWSGVLSLGRLGAAGAVWCERSRTCAAAMCSAIRRPTWPATARGATWRSGHGRPITSSAAEADTSRRIDRPGRTRASSKRSCETAGGFGILNHERGLAEDRQPGDVARALGFSVRDGVAAPRTDFPSEAQRRSRALSSARP